MTQAQEEGIRPLPDEGDTVVWRTKKGWRAQGIFRFQQDDGFWVVAKPVVEYARHMKDYAIDPARVLSVIKPTDESN